MLYRKMIVCSVMNCITISVKKTSLAFGHPGVNGSVLTA